MRWPPARFRGGGVTRCYAVNLSHRIAPPTKWKAGPSEVHPTRPRPPAKRNTSPRAAVSVMAVALCASTGLGAKAAIKMGECPFATVGQVSQALLHGSTAHDGNHHLQLLTNMLRIRAAEWALQSADSYKPRGDWVTLDVRRAVLRARHVSRTGNISTAAAACASTLPSRGRSTARAPCRTRSSRVNRYT
jgi:hypothetical protein